MQLVRGRLFRVRIEPRSSQHIGVKAGEEGSSERRSRRKTRGVGRKRGCEGTGSGVPFDRRFHKRHQLGELREASDNRRYLKKPVESGGNGQLMRITSRRIRVNESESLCPGLLERAVPGV